MANGNSTAPNEPTHNTLCDELHEIAGRLAGVESVLRRVVDDGDAELGNALHLMARITADANHQICVCADQVSALGKRDAK